MIRRPPRSTQSRSSAASDVYKRQADDLVEEIDTITAHLAEYRKAIAGNDAETLFRLLDDGRRIKEELDR